MSLYRSAINGKTKAVKDKISSLKRERGNLNLASER